MICIFSTVFPRALSRLYDLIFKNNKKDEKNNVLGFDSVDRLKGTLKFFKKFKGDKSPSFNYIHLMSPHGPTKFDESGNTVHPTWEPSVDQFVGEIKYLNQKVLEIIDDIKENYGENCHFLVLSDHGTELGKSWVDGKPEARLLNNFLYVITPEMKFENSLPDKISLRNLFRYYLNFFHGEKLEILKSRFFLTTKGMNDLFHFEEKYIE